MEIRPAVVHDIASPLADLWKEQMTLIGQFDPRFTPTPQQCAAWEQGLARRLLSGEGIVFVAYSSAEIAGYIAGYITTHAQTRYGIIDQMALDAHTYRGGMGRKLFTAISRWFAGHQSDISAVCVPRCYMAAAAFWASLGAVTWENPALAPVPGHVWLKLPPG